MNANLAVMKNDYYILRASRIIKGKTLKLYILDESNDSMLENKAIEVLMTRGMSEEQAKIYLSSLEYVPTRGG